MVQYMYIQEARNLLRTFEAPAVVKLLCITVKLHSKLTALLLQLLYQSHHVPSSARNNDTIGSNFLLIA